MSVVVPFCAEVGLKAPAHYDAAQQRYVIDVPFPSAFDAENKRWKYEDGAITWEQVLTRWKARGPMNDEYVATLQRGARLRGNGHGH